MVVRWKAFSLIFSWDHCQRSSPSEISDTPQAGFEPAENLSSGLVKGSCAVLITTTPYDNIYIYIYIYQNDKEIKPIYIFDTYILYYTIIYIILYAYYIILYILYYILCIISNIIIYTIHSIYIYKFIYIINAYVYINLYVNMSNIYIIYVNTIYIQ